MLEKSLLTYIRHLHSEALLVSVFTEMEAFFIYLKENFLSECDLHRYSLNKIITGDATLFSIMSLDGSC